jgi:ATP-binding cassette, subfamily D (ALD), member 3
MAFFKRLYNLLKIAIPSWTDSVVIDMTSLTFFLVVRTFLSIYISRINGDIVKNIVNYDFNGFLRGLSTLGLISLPASFINSYLDFQNKVIALKLRKNVTKHFHQLYIKDLIYYQVCMY